MNIFDKTFQEYPEINSDLKKVAFLLSENIPITNKKVQKLVSQQINNGKMLRPTFVLLFNHFGSSPDKQKSLHLAAAVEALHNATLIHDDIIDQSETRRGQLSLSKATNNSIAVYAGDLMLTFASQQLSIVNDNEINKIFNQHILDVLNGELMQETNRFNVIKIDQYIHQISHKTAKLFSLSAILGVKANDSKFTNLAEQIGLNIGIAFQLIDDYLDFQGKQNNLGKPIMQDLKLGVYSAPIIFSGLKAPQLKTLISNDQFDQLTVLIQQNGGLNMTAELAQTYTKKAQLLISELPNNDAKDLLSKLSNELLTRIK